jgi:hypothetical protein
MAAILCSLPVKCLLSILFRVYIIPPLTSDTRIGAAQDFTDFSGVRTLTNKVFSFATIEAQLLYAAPSHLVCARLPIRYTGLDNQAEAGPAGWCLTHQELRWLVRLLIILSMILA